jgi:hypothetical protein
VSAPLGDSPAGLEAALRIAGATQIALGLAHVAFWRVFGWTAETARLSPLTARVFAAHTFFIAFLLVALGGLALGRADLLIAPSELAELVLGTSLVFWLLRLLAQPLVFDAALADAPPWLRALRAGAFALLSAYVVVYAWASANQLAWLREPGVVLFAPLDARAPSSWARVVVATVWLGFGVAFKLLRLVPRHERIVARILGDAAAPALTRMIGVGEATIGLWALSGFLAPWCALAQTALVVTMNAIEIRRARDLLLAPVPMVAANVALLALAWFAALAH